MAWSAPTEWERWDPEQFLVCPYDPVHKVAAKKFQCHLLKCRKNHPDKDFVTCPFNAKHVMLRPALRHHVGSCPDRSVIEQYSFPGSEKDRDGFYFKGDTSLPEYYNQGEIHSSENWDDDETENLGYHQSHQHSSEPNNLRDSTKPNTVRDTLSLNPKDRRELKSNLRRQAVQATHGTGMQDNQHFSSQANASALKSPPVQPYNNSIYMYGIQQTQLAARKNTFPAQTVSQPNRRSLTQAPNASCYGRGNGTQIGYTSGNAPVRPGIKTYAKKLSGNSSGFAEVPSNRPRFTEHKDSVHNSHSSCSVSEGLDTTLKAENQSVDGQNSQASNNSKSSGSLQGSSISRTPYTPGVGRARLLAEARKNNFGGICSFPKETGLLGSLPGRGRGVLKSQEPF